MVKSQQVDLIWGCGRLVSRAKVIENQILPAPPGLPRRPAVLVLPGQPILVGRPYRTQSNRVLNMLSAIKRVGPLPTHRLALIYSADYSLSDHVTSDDSSRDSLSDSLLETSSDSSGHPILDSPCDSPTATNVILLV
ncbi:hypothetical protein Tco_1257172 [Tanacetum coccineum]